MLNSRRNRLARTLVAFGLIWALAPVAALAAGLGDFQDTSPGSSQALVLEVGRSIMLRFDGMTRVAIVHPEVADVSVVSAAELLVVATAKPIRDQVHTMLYVWDARGLHKFAVTVVGMKMAERIAFDLRRSLSPNLNIEVVSDTLVVVEGQVADEDALDNLKTLLQAASTEDVQVVGMVSTAEGEQSLAARTGTALSEILDPRLQVTAWGEDVIVVEGELGSDAEVLRARQAVTALSEGLRVVDMIGVTGVDLAAQAPMAQIQRLLGEEFVVTQLRGNLVAVDGVVGSEGELERVTRLLEAYSEQVQTINMVQVVTPKADLPAAQHALQGALGDQLRVSLVGQEALMIEGSVPSEEGLDQVAQVLALFEDRVPVVNLTTVVEPNRRRVLVAVRVLEVTKGGDEALGIDWGQYAVTSGGVAFQPQPFLMGQVPGLDGWRELYKFATQIHALIGAQKAHVLAEPNLLVNEGEEAEILIGGELPIPITQSGAGGFASVTVEWKPYGVNLKISPTISPDQERVQLEVEPEVSSLDYGNGVTVGGLFIPGMRTRRVRSIVTIPDGAVLAIAGLIASDQSRAVSKIPVLGDLPIIGPLFRHDTFINNMSELIILVFPQILDEDGVPVHPITVPEEFEGEDILNFGSRSVGELELTE